MMLVGTKFNEFQEIALNQKLRSISILLAGFRILIPKRCSRIRSKNSNHSCVTCVCACYRDGNVQTDVKAVADLEEIAMTAFR
jgi:hypothetical protein